VRDRALRQFCVLIGTVSWSAISCSLCADSIVLTPVADTTLVEVAPGNNLGGQTFVNAGTTQNSNYNRGLFRFDVAANIPPASIITSAYLMLEVVHTPSCGDSPSQFDLHRLQAPWGEGDKTNSPTGSPGQGQPATTNEATWVARFAFTTNLWAAPGAAATNDYAPGISSSSFVYGLEQSPYSFDSTPVMVADVQTWLDNPGTNFGWILICDSEDVQFTARRFGSREDPQKAPLLTIEYTPPEINRVQATGGQFSLAFTAQANQTYAVEFLDSFSTLVNWSTLTNFAAQPASTNIVVSDALTNRQRFYRLRLP